MSVSFENVLFGIWRLRLTAVVCMLLAHLCYITYCHLQGGTSGVQYISSRRCAADNSSQAEQVYVGVRAPHTSVV
jgi:hypothetical protein